MAAAALVVAGLGTRAQEHGALPIEALTTMRAIAGLWPIGSLSPDGRWLVYAVRTESESSSEGGSEQYSATGMGGAFSTGSDLWLTDTRTGRTERITDAKGAVEEPVWSPDGRHVAFYSDRDGKARLWVWERETRRLRRLSEALVHPSRFSEARLRWTPDSQAIVALLAAAQLGATRQAAGEATPATRPDPTIVPGATVRVYRSHQRPEVPRPAPEADGLDATTIDTTPLFQLMQADLAIVSLADGAVRRVARNKGLFWYDVSPDGKWVAWSHQTARYPGIGQSLYDYEIASTAGGEARVAVHRAPAEYGAATWSPDGRTIAWLTNGPAENGDVHLIDAATAQDRRLTMAPHPKLGFSGAWKAYWSPDGRSLYVAGSSRDGRTTRPGGLWKATVDSDRLVRVTPEYWDREVIHILSDPTANQLWTRDGGRTVTVTTRDPETKMAGFYAIDTATGTATTLREEARHYGSASHNPPLTSVDKSTVVYLAEDARRPPDFWAAAPDLSEARQITELNPELARVALGESRLVEFLGTAGQRLRGVLVLPAGYQPGVRYPTIAYVYPGPTPHANAVNRFQAGTFGVCGLSNQQVLASRGYAVLLAEMPQQRGTPMKDLADGVHLAINKVIEMGIADPDRLGVCGQSYGGYATISILAQTTRFKGAVMSAGFGDLVATYLSFVPANGRDGTIWAEGGQGMMGGTLWQYPERYLENSPIMYLDRVRTSLLVVHGEDDDVVLVPLADQIFAGLRRLGREVEYRRYANEGHVVLGRENHIDYWNAVIRWFDTHVKKPAPATTR